MTPAWVVAAGVLTLLVLALTAVVVRLLGVVSSQDGMIRALGRDVALLRRGSAVPQPWALAPAEVGTNSSLPASVLVVLEADLDATRSLALDLRASGAPAVGVPLRVLVEDSDAGRSLATGLPVAVEYEQRDGALPAGAPSVLVLDASGAVLAKGSPASVDELERLVREAG